MWDRLDWTIRNPVFALRLSVRRFRRRIARPLGRIVWRRENIGLAGRLAVSLILIVVSAPSLEQVFANESGYWPGIQFDATADCVLSNVSISNDFNVDAEGRASGTVAVRWGGNDENCKVLRFEVPVEVRRVGAGDHAFFDEGKSTDSAVTVEPGRVVMNVQSLKAEGYIGATLTLGEFQFISPVTYVRSVTQTAARAHYAPPGGLRGTDEVSVQDYARQIIQIPVEMTSRVTLPFRYEVTNAMVQSIQSQALDKGASRIEYEGSGVISLEDREHAERKDQVILISGTLLATGLAMLAEFVCKLAESVGERRETTVK